MEVIVNQEILDEVNNFLNQDLIKLLDNSGMSFTAIAFIIQSLVKAVDEAQDKLDESEI